ncbi:hypothetical protein ACA910_020840 [Epithemia clementina (nom. ined.)]
MVASVSRFNNDIHALQMLTESFEPPCVLVRPESKALATMMFGDASGAGFVTSLWLQGSKHVHAEHVVWTRAYGGQSSNFRELYNLVARVEALVLEGELVCGTELFIFIQTTLQWNWPFTAERPGPSCFLTWCCACKN